MSKKESTIVIPDSSAPKQNAEVPPPPVRPNSTPITPSPNTSTFTSIFIPVTKKEPEKYISLSDIRKDFQSIIDDTECPSYIAARIGLVIELLQPADVIPVQYSHWIYDKREVPVKDNWFLRLFNRKTMIIPVVRCSNCGTQRKGPLSYCSNCGSKMNKKVYRA